MKSNQVFGPYGNARYFKGSINTLKGFTGQYADALTGLDYYNARYYDPVAGVFLSADVKQGNAQGMNPYAYVGGNPETYGDPSGRYVVGSNGEAWYPGSPYYTQGGVAYLIGNGKPYPLSHPSTGNSGSMTGSGNPKIALLPANVCNKACGDRDRQLIVDQLNKQKTYANNVSVAIGDGVALAADIIAAILQAVEGDWKGFAMEVVSTLARAATLAGDLGTLGVFKMPTAIADFLSGLKWVAKIIDAIGGWINIFNPAKPIIDALGNAIVQKAKPLIVAGVIQVIAGAASATGTLFVPKMMNAFYWDEQIANVGAYSDQQAHNVCIHDYASEPGMC
jgi:RHS repeat-associated protein